MNTDDHRSAIDTSIPHPARRYNYWLGGKDNFAADRESGDRIEATFPTVRVAAVENWRFMQRAVQHFAEQGFDQFLDIGCGIPLSPTVHEIAEGARVVYADNDRLVMAHTRALRTGDLVSYIEADLRDPDTILEDPALRIFDFTRPIVLLLVAVVHFLTDNDAPYGSVAKVIGNLPPGSVVVLSSGDETLHQFDGPADLTSANGPFRARSKDEVLRFVDGLDISEPGITSIVEWFPKIEPQPEASAEDVAAYGIVATIPNRTERTRGVTKMSVTRASVETPGGNDLRHYEPGVEFHARHCVESKNRIEVRTVSVIGEFPNYRFHFCFDATVAAGITRDPEAIASITPYVVVEKPDYGRHPYAPSRPEDKTPHPPDAIRPLCRVCRGTHRGEA